MSKGFKKFLLLWLASLISATGSGMTAFALGVYIYKKTGLGTASGILMLAGFLPGLLLSPLAGILADRYDRRFLMMIGDGFSVLGLLIICIGTGISNPVILIAAVGFGALVSSAFSSLVEPSFKATVSELLTKEEYSRAGGMTQLVNVSRYLLSPLIAGAMLMIYGIYPIILIDISTIGLIVLATYVVKSEMKIENDERNGDERDSAVQKSFNIRQDLISGFLTVYADKGVWTLVIFGIIASFCLGTIQILLPPMVLAFADEILLATINTVSALGMLFAGILLSNIKIKQGFADVLRLSLAAVGIAMIFFGLRENRYMIFISGFCIFAALSFANISIDCLVRTGIPKEHEGKAWGFIGLISQMGYVLAYISMGIVYDCLAKPLFVHGGALTCTLGGIMGIGEGRGAGFIIILAGILLIIAAASLLSSEEIKALEARNMKSENRDGRSFKAETPDNRNLKAEHGETECT